MLQGVLAAGHAPVARHVRTLVGVRIRRDSTCAGGRLYAGPCRASQVWRLNRVGGRIAMVWQQYPSSLSPLSAAYARRLGIALRSGRLRPPRIGFGESGASGIRSSERQFRKGWRDSWSRRPRDSSARYVPAGSPNSTRNRTPLILAARRKRWVRQQAPPGRIACPTLVIAASNDRGVPMHHATMLHDGISGSRLVVVDGADHALIWTQDRAECCRSRSRGARLTSA